MRNSVAVLPLKSKLSWKFQHFNATDGSIKILRYSWISKNSIEIKKCKRFFETQVAIYFKEVMQPPTR